MNDHHGVFPAACDPVRVGASAEVAVVQAQQLVALRVHAAVIQVRLGIPQTVAVAVAGVLRPIL